ncbi:helix-turn-helix domain-containing protein, partial [Shewanella sp.]|uniref:helix-turn-helix domain-containing protein n=1 Tax=Shewanella sp. TaxID=50422 RepID=UPI0026059433
DAVSHPLSSTIAVQPNAQLLTAETAEINSLHGAIYSNVLQAFQACNGNVSQCAKRLGISRNALYRKLKQFGIKG